MRFTYKDSLLPHVSFHLLFSVYFLEPYLRNITSVAFTTPPLSTTLFTLSHEKYTCAFRIHNKYLQKRIVNQHVSVLTLTKHPLLCTNKAGDVLLYSLPFLKSYFMLFRYLYSSLLVVSTMDVCESKVFSNVSSDFKKL